MKKISVITVCYNSASTIEATMKSVFSQDYKNVEYIIIDGGSTDDTLKIIEPFKTRLAVLLSEKDE
jgi:glycosyltransferase involved in cell wall biosynthesis